eukprot:3609515-Karenia_brevis.AAC.1
MAGLKIEAEAGAVTTCLAALQWKVVPLYEIVKISQDDQTSCWVVAADEAPSRALFNTTCDRVLIKLE